MSSHSDDTHIPSSTLGSPRPWADAETLETVGVPGRAPFILKWNQFWVGLG